MIKDNRQLIVIMGPTASGKTDLAIRLAQRVNGEIVSADSMQVYRGPDIGTAKPTQAELALVPHHLVSILDLDEELDVYRFVELAQRAVDKIRTRSRVPIVSGGTGFYIKSLLYGLALLPGDKELRQKLDEKYDGDENFEKLRQLMEQLDPADYKRWHRHQRKLIRSLEVFKLTGKSITELQSEHKPQLHYNVKAYCLNWNRDVLRQRIRLRTSQMLQNGWIQEAETLIGQGILASPTAHQALGYQIINEYLNNNINYETMEETIATKTWQFARRQMTWFRNQHPEAIRLEMPLSDHDLEEIVLGVE